MKRRFWQSVERAHRRAAADYRATRDRAASMMRRHEHAARVASRRAGR